MQSKGNNYLLGWRTRGLLKKIQLSISILILEDIFVKNWKIIQCAIFALFEKIRKRFSNVLYCQTLTVE